MIGLDSSSALKYIVNFLVVPESQIHGESVKGQVLLLF